ncbi:MAG: SDR family oxidoreductase [Steroidobacteraceae bacterium]|nr:SDR family oxidoreductase [Steroidobacteraceae bacterium]MDW8258880.1 SDR family oxidoreductase [Gammaproteobacteria bacterium]
MDLGLRGKKAIVTGATRGIGRGVAELLAAEGADIAFCARSPEEVAETQKAVAARGVTCLGEALNVREAEPYKAWLLKAAEALGGCDIFIAGVSAGAGMDSEKNWVRNFEIDVLHTVRGCETLLPLLEKSGAGSIVIIGSTNAVETFAAPMAYNAMKAALVTYGKQLSQFVGRKGVRVNVVSPGPIYFEGGAWEVIKGTQPKFYDWAIKQFPNGRMGTVEEIARVIVFTASPAASLITGANIIADNGFTKRVQL